MPRRSAVVVPMLLAAVAVAVAVAVAAVAVAPATAQAQSRTSLYDTFLVSKAQDGGLPDGPSRNAVFSQDGRRASVLAFESDATNIVSGDTNGLTDVFYQERKDNGSGGEPWVSRGTRLVSKGRGGTPANGRSYGAAVDGDSSSGNGNANTAPTCIAFVSEASNLVPGDTNRKADAFVYVVRTGRIERVSVSSTGTQSNGDTFDVAVDGTCSRVAFTSYATNIAQTDNGPSKNPNYGASKTDEPLSGVKNVYVHVLGAEKDSDKSLIGLTFLASATNTGKPSNKDSYDPSWSLRTGQALAFTSNATNLDARDRNNFPDVYVKGMGRVIRFFGKPGSRVKLATLVTKIRVASVNPDTQRAGNGPSTNGSVSDQGCSVAFATQSTDIYGGDNNSDSDIVRADIRGFMLENRILPKDPPGCREIEGSAAPKGDNITITKIARGDHPTTAPVSVGGGDYITFTSDADTFPGVTKAVGDENGVSDVFLWSGTRATGNVTRLLSADTDNQQLVLPSFNAAPSQRINYIMFETNDPFADKVAAARFDFGTTDRVAIYAQANTGLDSRFHQVYMRYLGPKTIRPE
jgi:hypothetical protein